MSITLNDSKKMIAASFILDGATMTEADVFEAQSVFYNERADYDAAAEIF